MSSSSRIAGCRAQAMFRALMWIAGIPAAANAQWTLTNLHPAAASTSRATGVHGGQQVGYAMVGGVYQHASLWTGSAASWIDLMPAGAFESRAFAVDAGVQAGWASGSPTPYAHAGVWSGAAAAWVDLHPNVFPPFTHSFVSGAGSGMQVGAVYPLGGTYWRASLWSGSAASWVSLHPALALWSFADGVGAGQQVGWARVSNVDGASLWMGSAASWVSLHPSGALNSRAFAVHGGRQVGYARVGAADHASLWSGSAVSWVDLNPPGASYSQALGVHAGQQVGFARFAGGGERAVLWSGSADSWIDLHAFAPAGFGSTRALGIWHDANSTTVVGYGDRTLPAREEALMWTLPRAVVTYCTPRTTSNGCVPTMAHAGVPSASAGLGFTIRGEEVINNKSGLLFYGVNGRANLAFQGGTLCVATPIKRTTAVNSGGNPPPNDCSGVFSLDMNAFAAGALGGGPLPALRVAGTLVDCQWWGRDPGFPSPINTILSDGLEYSVEP